MNSWVSSILLEIRTRIQMSQHFDIRNIYVKQKSWKTSLYCKIIQSSKKKHF